MTLFETLILIALGHNLLGCIFMLLFCSEFYTYTTEVNFEKLNPRYIYSNYRLNWFGTIMLFLFGNLLCPIGSIIYWFYKLCTVGRR